MPLLDTAQNQIELWGSLGTFLTKISKVEEKILTFLVKIFKQEIYLYGITYSCLMLDCKVFSWMRRYLKVSLLGDILHIPKIRS